MLMVKRGLRLSLLHGVDFTGYFQANRWILENSCFKTVEAGKEHEIISIDRVDLVILAFLMFATSVSTAQYPWEKKDANTAGQQEPKAETGQKKLRQVTVGAFSFTTHFTVISHNDPDLGETTVLVDESGTPQVALKFDQEPFADATPLDEAQSFLEDYITHQYVKQVRLGKNDVLIFIDAEGDSIHEAFINLGPSMYNVLIAYNGSVKNITEGEEEVLSSLVISDLRSATKGVVIVIDFQGIIRRTETSAGSL